MSERWWETETAWFSFCHPERKLGGWLYSMFRPNIGTVAGGAWIWDASAHLPWEVPYSTNYTALRIPQGQDLTNISLPTGVTIHALEPLKRYRLGYHDEERLSLDLTYEAVMAPRALHKAESSFKNLNHFDQFGRVTGEIVLHGETIAIDCIRCATAVGVHGPNIARARAPMSPARPPRTMRFWPSPNGTMRPIPSPMAS